MKKPPPVQHWRGSSIMGLGRFERPTSRLSGVRSNHLSYRPWPEGCTAYRSVTIGRHPSTTRADRFRARLSHDTGSDVRVVRPESGFRSLWDLLAMLQKGGDPAAGSPTATLLRLRPSHRARLRPLPPLRVGPRTSGAPNSHGVTGGVYKARERIHRGVADPRLLAIPASRGRVADHDPNLDRVSGIRSALRPRSPLSLPL